MRSVKRRWIEELLEALWAYRCTLQSSTKETPFSLTYGSDAMLPVELGEPSLHREIFDLKLNRESLMPSLDLVCELRDETRVREEASKRRAERKYNSKVKPRSFHAGDLIWRMRSEARQGEGKFSTNWERPFRVRQVAGNGAYHLEHLFGKTIPRTWNASHLKFYFS